MLRNTLFFCSLLLPTLIAAAQPDSRAIERLYPEIGKLYLQLHQNPELSLAEKETSALLAGQMREMGFKVTEGVGGYGVVSVLKNGRGPTLMLRADMDALPVEEQTGLDYASRIRRTDRAGNDVPVMHACGHDVHMSVFMGTARYLTTHLQDWSGTLLMILQGAEEIGAGARMLLEDGLFKRFPRPDFNLALHVAADLPAGSIGYSAGSALASVDSVNILVKGVGGHGAYPHLTKDPVVLASQLVLALQTIVSREIKPLEPAVITVGSIHGGAKHNIIPAQVRLQLTLRSYSTEVREQTIAAIRRIAAGLAAAMGLPEELYPVVEVTNESTPSTYNDPALTRQLAQVFADTLENKRVIEREPVMGGEDFSRYGLVEPLIPSTIFWLGAVPESKYRAARAKGVSLPSLHSPFFAPDPKPTIKTGIRVMTAAALEILGGNKGRKRRR